MLAGHTGALNQHKGNKILQLLHDRQHAADFFKPWGVSFDLLKLLLCTMCAAACCVLWSVSAVKTGDTGGAG